MATKKKSIEHWEEKGKKLELLYWISSELYVSEHKKHETFDDFLFQASDRPEIIFRDIFQLFHDMVNYYVPKGKDEYMDKETIGFVSYDTSQLFVKDCDNPFFADRPFANRLMNLISKFKKGIQNNQIYLFEGPPGSGKSTFLNNLLMKFEEYTKTPEGEIYETLWKIDVEKFDLIRRKVKGLPPIDYEHQNTNNRVIEIPCPNHDHPILLIHRAYRQRFLDELIDDKKFKQKLFHDKEYNWVLKDTPCSICNSIYNTLLEELGVPVEVFKMVHARRVDFNRQFGRGISVFNPGDEGSTKPQSNYTLQNYINEVFQNENIKYIYSTLADTNNGVYALMDIKEHNVDRLMDLHGIISDGIHKVDLVEERIKSLFVGLVNPEDKRYYENVKSFQDRIINISIPYILDYNTEVVIYINKFGEDITEKFLPRVLTNFAKIIISTRLNRESEAIRKWIIHPEKYSKYVDRNFLLLKMDVYTGKIPEWLSEEDVKRFDRQTRKDIVGASETEGLKGISGRQSLSIFSNFYSRHANSDKLITMDMIKDFFEENAGEPEFSEIPDGFINSLESSYGFNALQEVKESIYYYNEKQISKDIMNYLYALNFEKGTTERCVYTGDNIDITEEFYKNFESIYLGTTTTDTIRHNFRNDLRSEYVTKTLAQEIRVLNKNIDETSQYKNLFERYTRNLKENALAPYTDNDNFRRALMDFGTDNFENNEERIKRDVKQLITNLHCKFNYTAEGAKQVSLYVIDKKLVRKY